VRYRRRPSATPNGESVHWYTPDEIARLAGLLESNREFLRALEDGRIDLAL
jgi:hypothetical protein